MTIENIREDIYQAALQETGGLHRSEAVFQVLTGILTESGHLTNPQWTPLRFRDRTSACAIEGYDIDEEDELLTVFAVLDAHAEVELDRSWSEATALKRDLDRTLREMASAVEAIAAGRSPELDSTDPAMDLVRSLRGKYLVAAERVAFCVLTTGRVTTAGSAEVANATIRTTIWDSERLVRIRESGREPLVADFSTKGGLPCLLSDEIATTIAAGNIGVLVTIVPAGDLAQLYNTYRSRLLERNVRAFLQATGKVNKGIRETILHEPEHFLSFNNGIAATASAASLSRGADGFYHLTEARDFQIVNGGQTTASIARCVRIEGADVSRIGVVMKLTVVPSERIEELVPRISRFANTQNRIQEADFFANSPWHVALERHSRSVEAERDAESNGKPIVWFYERVRGQYADELSRFATSAQKNAFKNRHPSRVRFSKTDVARYVLAWEQDPHIVSLGGQKCFGRFMGVLGAVGGDQEGSQLPGEEDFRRICCLAILQRQGERISRELGIQGYRANLVAYSLAMISVATDRKLPWRRIWALQDVTPELDRALRVAIPACDRAIRESAGTHNVSEWAKKSEVRDIVLASQVELGLKAEADWDQFSMRDMARPKRDVDLLKILRKVGAAGWQAIAREARRRGERGIGADVADTFRERNLVSGRSPSPKQIKILLRSLKRHLELPVVKMALEPADLALLHVAEAAEPSGEESA